MSEKQDYEIGTAYRYVRDSEQRVWILNAVRQTDAGPVYQLGAPSSPGFHHWQSANPTQMAEDYVRVE